MRRRRWQCVGDVGNASATLAIRRRRWQFGGDVGIMSARLAINTSARGWQSRWHAYGGEVGSQYVGDAGNALATLAMRRRRWQCVGDVGNASATLAMRRQRWQYVGDLGNTSARFGVNTSARVASQYVGDVDVGNTSATLTMRLRGWSIRLRGWQTLLRLIMHRC